MNDKELIQKLKSLKVICPSAAWKQEARGILLSQVSNAVGAEVRFGVLENVSLVFKNAFSFVPKAAWGVICLAVVLVGGSLGTYAANTSKPGDSLYTARIIKEKAQLAMVFNKEEKAKLDMKMANSHAKEISEVLASTGYSGNEKKSEQLAQSFVQEINTVKERLSEINKIQNKNAVAVASVVATNSLNGELAANSDDKAIGIGKVQKDVDGKINIVDANKDNKGMQVYDPSAVKTGVLSTSKIPTTTIAGNTQKYSDSNVSSTFTSSTPVAAVNVSDSINDTLDKATESFNTKDFTGAKDILEQVGAIMENLDSGSVKGIIEVETATSVKEVIGSSSESK